MTITTAPNEPRIEQELGLLAFDVASQKQATRIMEELRQEAAKVFGVTVIGPNMTLRFGKGDRLVQVSFLVTSITDSTVLEEPDYDDDK